MQHECVPCEIKQQHRERSRSQGRRSLHQTGKWTPKSLFLGKHIYFLFPSVRPSAPVLTSFPLSFQPLVSSSPIHFSSHFLYPVLYIYVSSNLLNPGSISLSISSSQSYNTWVNKQTNQVNHITSFAAAIKIQLQSAFSKSQQTGLIFLSSPPTWFHYLIWPHCVTWSN